MHRIIICLALLAVALSAQAATPDSSSNAAAKVEKPVDLQFNNVPLGDALTALFKDTGKNYILDPALQQLRFTGVLKNISFDTAVSGMLKAAGAAYYVDEKGIYHITYPQQAFGAMTNYAGALPTIVNNAAAASPPPVTADATLSMSPSPAPGAGSPAARKAAAPLKSQAVNTRYVDPGQVANVLRVTPGVTQVETTNGRQIIVSGTDEGIANATKALNSLDNEFALPRSVRLRVSARVTVGSNRGPKTYEASTESVGAEQMPSLLNLDAQMPASNVTVGTTTIKNAGINRMSLVNATLTPSFVADKIALVGRGHFSCPFGNGPGMELSKDFDVAASVVPGKPYTVAAGSVSMVFGNVDFAVSVTATPEDGRLPSFQNTIQPGNYYNAAPPANAPRQ